MIFRAFRLPFENGTYFLKKGNFMKNLKQKIAIALAISSMLALSAPVHAEGIADIGTQIVTQVNAVAPVVTSVGVALLAVYVLMKAFRLVASFVGGR